MDCYGKAQAMAPALTEIRRHLHRHPEASMKEFATAQYIRRTLTDWGVEWQEAGPTGTVAKLGGRQPGKVLGLRADIDALELDELSGRDYASENPGVMHACGHDAHAAALLGAVRILKEQEDALPGTVKLIFQPGEENGEGALSVVQSGAVDDVTAFFALHVSSSIPFGRATIKSGVVSAANDKFRITLKGIGCHGSCPEKGVDALLAGSALVQNLQSLVSRETSPFMTSTMNIGIFRAGTAFNILPEDAYIEGSIRVLDENQRMYNRSAIRRIAKCTAKAYRAVATVDFDCTAKIVYNNKTLTETAETAAREILGETAVTEQEASLGAEDFAFFLDIAPGTYINIGSRNESLGITAPHHHGSFDVDEQSLPVCAAMYAAFALRFFGVDPD